MRSVCHSIATLLHRKQHSLGHPMTAEVTQETHCSSLSVSGAKIPVNLSSVTYRCPYLRFNLYEFLSITYPWIL